MGRFYSTEAPQGVLQTRIDKAILPVWPNGRQSAINTGFLNRIPKGTTVYEGLTAPQGGIFLGGTTQTYVPIRLGIISLSNYPLK